MSEQIIAAQVLDASDASRFDRICNLPEAIHYAASVGFRGVSGGHFGVAPSNQACVTSSFTVYERRGEDVLFTLCNEPSLNPLCSDIQRLFEVYELPDAIATADRQARARRGLLRRIQDWISPRQIEPLRAEADQLRDWAVRLLSTDQPCACDMTKLREIIPAGEGPTRYGFSLTYGDFDRLFAPECLDHSSAHLLRILFRSFDLDGDPTNLETETWSRRTQVFQSALLHLTTEQRGPIPGLREYVDQFASPGTGDLGGEILVFSKELLLHNLGPHPLIMPVSVMLGQRGLCHVAGAVNCTCRDATIVCLFGADQR
jgi:hypothetical protein